MSKKKTPSALRKAFDILGLTQTEFAKIFNCKQQTIFKWLKDDRIPVAHVLTLEKAVKGKVTRHQLRPDIYPKERG